MAKTVGLPLGDQLGIALDHFAKHRQVRFRLLKAFREMHGQHVFAEFFLLFGALGVVEIFEVTETHMARREAQDHGGALLFLTPHRRIGADDAQRAGSRDF
ncbi:hypothetical protein D3C80_1942500 [compost metagenome]